MTRQEPSMCGRFTIKITVADVVEIFGIDRVAESFEPSFNVAPGRPVPVVTREEAGNVLDAYRWGLIPHWAKEAAIGYKMINARAETVAEKPSFRNSFRRKRCLILADGFFEWKKEGSKKVPHYIFVKDRPVFGFAGLWDEWRPEEGEPIRSCTIITTEANTFMKPLHHRMPVILPQDAEAIWLDPTIQDRDGLKGLLNQYDGDLLEAHPVSTLVNSPKNDDPQCILPLG